MAWSDPLNPNSLCSDLENDFLSMNLNGPKMPPPNGQWGREVNQSTPWEMDARFGNDGSGGQRFGPGGKI